MIRRYPSATSNFQKQTQPHSFLEKNEWAAGFIHRFAGPGFIRELNDDLLTSLTGPADELLSVLSDENLFAIEPEENIRYYRAKKKMRFQSNLPG